MVYGIYAKADPSSEDTSDPENIVQTKSAKTRAFLTYVDFSSLHESQCKGADYAGESDSDYELWTPYDGRHGKDQCFLGQQVTYVRRKQNVMCYNGEDLDRVTQRTPCTCTT